MALKKLSETCEPTLNQLAAVPWGAIPAVKTCANELRIQVNFVQKHGELIYRHTHGRLNSKRGACTTIALWVVLTFTPPWSKSSREVSLNLPSSILVVSHDFLCWWKWKALSGWVGLKIVPPTWWSNLHISETVMVKLIILRTH